MTTPSPGASGGSDAPLVLVVDDNERNRKLSREVLREAGLRTLEAATGREAIALAEEWLPDVILLDLRLPDMDGTDVACALRERARTAHIPLVALSALAGVDHGDARVSAFDGFLGKPIDVLAFPEQVCGYCTGGPTERSP